MRLKLDETARGYWKGKLVLMGEEFLDRRPHIAEVLGPAWLRRMPDWLQTHVTRGSAWLRQLDGDLAALTRAIPIQRLIACYRAMLRDREGFLETLYAVHGAALLASGAGRVELHVPRADGNGRNYHVRAEIKGHVIQADSKTRTDDFPLTAPRTSEGYFAARPVLDPHEAADLGLPVRRPAVEDVHFKATPESTVIRQVLLDGLAQLPESGYNLVLFGHINGSREHLERALAGGEFVDLHRNHETKQVTSEVRRGPGAFTPGRTGDPFEPLSAVLWMRLLQLAGGRMAQDYLLYPNPRARWPLPPEVLEALDRTMQAWTTVPEGGGPS